MKYEKVSARRWDFNCAESGFHPEWAFDNARDFALIAQEKGIEPWKIFPGTRQVMIETYDQVTPYQLSVFAKALEDSKRSCKLIEKVWMAGNYVIYIDYVGGVDYEKASKIPDFKVGDKLKHLVSGEIAKVVEVTDDAFGLVFNKGSFTHHYEKKIVKCQYKLIKSK